MSYSLKIFAAIFVVLGAVAFFIGEEGVPEPGDLALTFTEYDSLMQAPVPGISPLELAEYLMKQEHHYNLIDVRGQQGSYRIPTSEPHSIESFLDEKVPVNETIILYSANETQALQLYYLLAIRGYFKVRVLQGGVAEWRREVLRPSRSTIAAEDFESRREITEFFGGSIASESGVEIDSFQPSAVQLEKRHKTHQGC